MDDIVLKTNKGQVAKGRCTRDRLVEAIRDYTLAHGYPPTVRELGDMVGLRSPSSVHFQLRQLAMDKRITWDPDRPRTLLLRGAPQRCPLCGHEGVAGPLAHTEDDIPIIRTARDQDNVETRGRL